MSRPMVRAFRSSPSDDVLIVNPIVDLSSPIRTITPAFPCSRPDDEALTYGAKWGGQDETKKKESGSSSSEHDSTDTSDGSSSSSSSSASESRGSVKEYPRCPRNHRLKHFVTPDAG